jgi:hypothetical protein
MTSVYSVCGSYVSWGLLHMASQPQSLLKAMQSFNFFFCNKQIFFQRVQNPVMALNSGIYNEVCI